MLLLQALFAQKVRTSLVCEDMPLQLEAGAVPSCGDWLAQNPLTCQTHKADLLFLCARSCGYWTGTDRASARTSTSTNVCTIVAV